MIVRASLGSLAVLGLTKLRMAAAPRTLYLLQYSRSGCAASCAFCPQSRVSKSDKRLLSRIPWPPVELKRIAESLSSKPRLLSRVCVQTVVKEGFEEELLEIVEILKSAGSDIPLSVATTPVEKELLRELKNLGVERLGVGLDAASPRVLESVGKPHSWSEYLDFVRGALEVFGRGRVHVHLIFGLGESELEFVETMARLYEMGSEVALFAFTPVKGTPMESVPPPDLESYRKIQLVRYLLSRGIGPREFLRVKGTRIYLRRGPWLERALEAFLTSGCPGCNRPFYNETPRVLYNYPSRELLERDREELEKAIRRVVE